MFKPVEIKWKGITYAVPGNEVMDLIDRIEDHVTLDDLHEMQSNGRIQRMKIARAYADSINYAVGIMNRDGGDENGNRYSPVTVEDIYNGFFNEEDAVTNTFVTVYGLIGMLIPPDHLEPQVDEDDVSNGEEADAKNGEAADS